MSISSMTGYGRGLAVNEQMRITVELKSVNHRFAEFHIRLPREWLSLEDSVRQILSGPIQRGRLDVFVNVDVVNQQTAVDVNWQLLEAFIDTEKQLLERFGTGLKVDTVRDWLKYPEVITPKTREVDTDMLAELVGQATREACAQLIKMRRAEGERLATNFASKLKDLSQFVSELESLDKQQVELRTRQIHERLGHYQIDVEPERLAQEVVLLVDRSAIDEELVRLASHIDGFREALLRTGSVGRRLDFIVQEMHREVNTIGSKSADARISNFVVEMKVLVEQLREQVQNVE